METVENYVDMKGALGKSFYNCQYELRAENQRSMAEITIEDPFSRK